MGTYQSFDAVPPHRIWHGAVARAVGGEAVQVALLELEADQPVPEHAHPNEQVGFVIEGSITMSIGGDVRELHAGGTYVIPPHVPHSATTGPRGAVVVDTFSPPRSDWAELPRLAPSPARWPPRTE